MTYKVVATGPDWVELWDGVSIVDPDLPSHKSTDTFMIGEHGFLVDDVVDISVRLVARIIPPELVAAREAVAGTEYQWLSDDELLGECETKNVASWGETAQTWLDIGREDRQVLDQHG